MGGLSTFMGVAQIGMGAYSAYQNTKQQNTQLAWQAAQQERRAALSEEMAAERLRRGERDTAKHRIDTRGMLSKMRVGYAASGVKVNQGTPVDVAADLAAWREYERQGIQHEAEISAWGLKNEATELRSSAAYSLSNRTSAGWNAAGYLLSNGNQIGNLFSGAGLFKSSYL